MSLSISLSPSASTAEDEKYKETVLRVYNAAGMPKEMMEGVEAFVQDNYLREDWDEQRAALIEKFLLERQNDDAFIAAKLNEHKKEIEKAQDELDAIMGGEGAHLKRKLSDDEVQGPNDESDEELIDSDFM